MATNFHDISDLEGIKLNQIIKEFSHDAVLHGFNDDCVYIAMGRDIYCMDRKQISPNIDIEKACKSITFFERI